MVRPIEISDAFSKVNAVERVQQTDKTQPEATQQFQKTLNEQTTVRVTTPNPVPQGDHVVIHVDEQEREKRKTDENEEQSTQQHKKENEQEKKEDDHGDNISPHDHIDIKV